MVLVSLPMALLAEKLGSAAEGREGTAPPRTPKVDATPRAKAPPRVKPPAKTPPVKHSAKTPPVKPPARTPLVKHLVKTPHAKTPVKKAPAPAATHMKKAAKAAVVQKKGAKGSPSGDRSSGSGVVTGGHVLSLVPDNVRRTGMMLCTVRRLGVRACMCFCVETLGFCLVGVGGFRLDGVTAAGLSIHDS